MGVEETTAVVFTGDHGESLGEHDEDTHGFLAYNSTMWIPLFVRAPGIAPASSARTSLTSTSSPRSATSSGSIARAACRGRRFCRSCAAGRSPIGRFISRPSVPITPWTGRRSAASSTDRKIHRFSPPLSSTTLARTSARPATWPGDADVAALRRSLEAIVQPILGRRRPGRTGARPGGARGN